MFFEYLKSSWKTTAAGFVTGLVALLAPYGVELTPEAQQHLTNTIFAGGLFLIGLFSKDRDADGQE